MTGSEAQDWSTIFDAFGRDTIRHILFHAALVADSDGRMVVEFSTNPSGKFTAVDITDHVAALEGLADQGEP